MMELLQQWLHAQGLEDLYATLVARAIGVAVVALLAWVVNFIAQRIVLRILQRIIERTSTKWDDAALNRRVFHRLCHLAPAFVLFGFAPVVFPAAEGLTTFVRRGAQVYMIGVSVAALHALLDAVGDIYGTFRIAWRFPIRVYLQVLKIIFAVAGGLFVLSVTLDRSPWVFLGGLGGLTAVLLLIFRDSLLGFVAGIQLVALDMLRPGDWIEMPKYGADGSVTEINLNTVKVQNWDKTITTVPTYALISDSFKNWRGMQESGGRRIKRAVYIDVNSIKYCTPEMIERFRKIQRLHDYIDRKTLELEEYNRANGIDDSVPVNGRRMTNVGTFRAYLAEYLKRHPKIHQNMTFLVRQLAPSEKGLPIEIYVFSNDQRWDYYEGIQADIFDHIYAALPEFDLRAFQNPTGADIAEGLGDHPRQGVPRPAEN